MNEPAVSVILPAFNSERTIAEAASSILAQSFSDFELILIDDGSQDGTLAILESFSSPKVKVIKHDFNRGLAAALNSGIRAAKGKYIARMDADDVSMPDRLLKQVSYMEKHPEISVLGCRYRDKKESGEERITAFFDGDAGIKFHMSLLPAEAFLCHPSVIMRKEDVLKTGLYDESLRLTQDKDLWIRMAAAGCRFANLPEVLLVRRKNVKSKDSHDFESSRKHELWRKNVYAKNAEALRTIALDFGRRLPRFSPAPPHAERTACAALWANVGESLAAKSRYREAKKTFKNSFSLLNAEGLSYPERLEYADALVKGAERLGELDYRGYKKLIKKHLETAFSLIRLPEEERDFILLNEFPQKMLEFGKRCIFLGFTGTARRAFLLSFRSPFSKKQAYVYWIKSFFLNRRRKMLPLVTFLSGSEVRKILVKKVSLLSEDSIRRRPLVPQYLFLVLLWRFKGKVFRKILAGKTAKVRKSRLRIGFITNEFAGDGQYCSGLSQYLYRTVKYLAEAGHDVHVITRHPFTGGKKKMEGFTVHRIRTGRSHSFSQRLMKKAGLPGTARILEFNNKVFRLIRYLDMVEPVDFLQFTNIYASSLTAGRRLKIPYAVRISSHRPSWNRLSGKPRNKDARAQEFLELWQIKRARYAFTPSEALRRIYEKESAVKHLSVIPTPVYIETGNTDDVLWRRYLQGKDYLLYFGSFKPSKGILLLAEVLPRFLERNPEAYAVLIGKDEKAPNRPSYRTLLEGRSGVVKDRLIIMDPVPHELLYPVVLHSKAIILPSLVDNLPNTGLEAMALGKCVIGTRGSSFEEILVHGVSGFLAEPRPETLEETLQEVWRRKDLDEIGEAAKRRAGDFAPEKCIKQLLSYYGAILSKESRLDFTLSGMEEPKGRIMLEKEAVQTGEAAQ